MTRARASPGTTAAGGLRVERDWGRWTVERACRDSTPAAPAADALPTPSLTRPPRLPPPPPLPSVRYCLDIKDPTQRDAAYNPQIYQVRKRGGEGGVRKRG